MASYLENPGNGVAAQTIAMGMMQRYSELLTHAGDHQDIAPALLRVEGARNAPLLLFEAIKARQEAVSWRNFCVGASALMCCISSDGPLDFKLLHGANNKPDPESEINIHAEHTIMSAAKQEEKSTGRKTIIPIMCVVGDLQPDQQSGQKTPTLHPCGICREAFKEPDSPVTPETLVITTNPDLTAIEWFSVRALWAIHEDRDNHLDEAGLAEFTERPLALTPVEHSSRSLEPISVADTPELEQSDREVMKRLQLPIMSLAIKLLNEAIERSEKIQ